MADLDKELLELARMREQVEAAAETLSSALGTVFRQLIKEGFTREEAFELSKLWMDRLLPKPKQVDQN